MWPSGMYVKPIVAWPGDRTPDHLRQRSRFGSAWSSTMSLLSRELDQVSAKDRILQVDIPESDFRLDGFPRANARQNSPAIIITFDAFHTTLSYPCDTFGSWQDNVRAVALALEALRKVDRYGVTKRGEQYQGFKALPPGSIAIGSSLTFNQAARVLVRLAGLDEWDEGLLRKVRNQAEVRREVYLKASARHHPDRGGESPDMVQVNEAVKVLDGGPVAG